MNKGGQVLTPLTEAAERDATSKEAKETLRKVRFLCILITYLYSIPFLTYLHEPNFTPFPGKKRETSSQGYEGTR